MATSDDLVTRDGAPERPTAPWWSRLVFWRPQRAPAALLSATRREREQQIYAALQNLGYQFLERTGGDAAGAAPMLRKNRETYLLELRHWNAAKVGLDAVQQMAQRMASSGASGGLLVTAGRFSRKAVAFATGCNVQLIDSTVLKGLVGRAGMPRP